MEATQDTKAYEKNQDFFRDNDWYKTAQSELELYKFIALCAAHETAGARRLLDIGNGGVFIYPTESIADVEAIDIFVEDDFRQRYPKVKWSQMSALDMHFDKGFDAVIAINTLHHIIGHNVRSTYQNLDKIMAEVTRLLEPGGKFVLLESTVPKWFLVIYKLIFRPLVKIWPLKHPPTFQFHFRDILAAAQNAGLELKEFCWVPKTSDFLTMGIRVKKWMTPIQVGKFVFVKPACAEQGKTAERAAA